MSAPRPVDFVRHGVRANTSPIAARNAVAVGVLGHRSMRTGCQPQKIPALPQAILNYFENGQK